MLTSSPETDGLTLSGKQFKGEGDYSSRGKQFIHSQSNGKKGGPPLGDSGRGEKGFRKKKRTPPSMTSNSRKGSKNNKGGEVYRGKGGYTSSIIHSEPKECGGCESGYKKLPPKKKKIKKEAASSL